MEFTLEEKIALFERINENYFKKNFGSMSKTDLETLLFSEYFNHYLANKIVPTDYQLSKELGITQNRIRTLKERKELKYPYLLSDEDWKKYFIDSAQNLKYDETDHRIKMIVRDVNVLIEVRNHLEEKGYFDDYSLNKKLLCLPLDTFIDVFIEDDAFEQLKADSLEKYLNSTQTNNDSSLSNFAKDFTKDGLKAFLMSASREMVLDVLKLLPFGGTAKTVIDFLMRAIKNAI